MLKGSARVAAMNEDGKSFVDDVTAGDVWFFPPGIPHSLQALDEGVRERDAGAAPGWRGRVQVRAPRS